MGPLVVARPPFHVTVLSIKPQRDQYKTASNKIENDSEFWAGTTEAIDVQGFKRFDCVVQVHQAGATAKARVVISTRGNIVTVTGVESLGVKPGQLFNALKAVAERFDYGVAARHYFSSHECGPPVTPVPIKDQSERDKHYSVTGNPYWLADVLHHLRDAGGFDEAGKIGPPPLATA